MKAVIFISLCNSPGVGTVQAKKQMYGLGTGIISCHRTLLGEVVWVSFVWL